MTNSITSKIDCSDEQINAAFAELGCASEISGDWAEPELFAVTSETLADFVAARAGYARPGRVAKQTETTLVLRDVSPERGAQKRDIYVVDFGQVRVACTIVG